MTELFNRQKVNYYLGAILLAFLITGAVLIMTQTAGQLVVRSVNILLLTLSLCMFSTAFYDFKIYRNSPVRNIKITTAVLWAVTAVLIILYLIPELADYRLPLSSSLLWIFASTILHSVLNYLSERKLEKFDFYKVNEAQPESIDISEVMLQKKEPTKQVIDEDGLDPMVLFDVENSGAQEFIEIRQIDSIDKLADYLSDLDIRVEPLGTPIAGVVIMEMCFNEEKGYYRFSDLQEFGGELGKLDIDFAFPRELQELPVLVETALRRLLKDNPGESVQKINVPNYQAMHKFYSYVQRLQRPENRSIDYLACHQGILNICNSSYVELYDCNLQSTLTSWVNDEGLIRTDQLGANGLTKLDDKDREWFYIDLPYSECRLADIKIVKEFQDKDCIKLHFILAELIDGQLTENKSGRSLLMRGDNISIKNEELSEAELLSVADYFAEKTVHPF
ncbi:hypothetical protein [Psychromonas aquimarina]|uniref:hypothetical protein n=1 Tax=Psychromonas aquimarina TaxID=444919 RepID=UPI000408CAF2|nr:hypothetical protein [Psychromonas aquimarina]